VGALAAEDRAALAEVLAGARPGAVLEGDNLDAMAAIPDGVVDLVYADPPFATGAVQRLTSIRTGIGERTRRGFGDREVAWEVVGEQAWADDLPLPEHLAAIRARLVEIRRVLAPHGSLYLHVDWRTVHHVRLLLDEVFGAQRFLNELVWAYDYGGRTRDRWPRKHDTILWYAKGEAWTFERDAIDRIPYMAPGLVGPEKAARGKLPTDVWWMTIVPPGSKERTGYPTQKPVRLLERIVAASSRPGDLVLDPYAGSGTTGVAAARLGRRWLLIDRNPAAVAIARARLAAGTGTAADPGAAAAGRDNPGTRDDPGTGAGG
jgi:site-specific DNA-methyltransferase (adenine-specific)